MNAITSIAVLPFSYAGPNPENDILADGLAEELLLVLSRIEGLRVMARSSSFQFRDGQTPMGEIARQLQVDYILEGKILQSRQQLRVSCQLVEAKTGFIVLSERLDRDLTDLFTVQDELAATIAGSLQLQLTEGELNQRIRSHPQGADAYRQLLRGKHAFHKNSTEGYQKALNHFEQALRLIHNLPEAKAGLSSSLSRLSLRGTLPYKEGMEKARKAALEAVSDAPEAVEPLLALAEAQFHNWEFQSVRETLQKAMALFPGHAPVRRVYARYLNSVLQWDQAISELKLARKIDPLSLNLQLSIAEIYYNKEAPDEAIERLLPILKNNPSYRPAMYIKGWSHFHKGELEAALQEFLRIDTLVPEHLKGTSSLACIYAAMGERQKALEILSKLQERQRQNPGSSIFIDFLFVYLYLGQPDTAIDYLQKTFDQHNSFLLFTYRHPALKALWHHPGFQQIHHRVGLPTHIASLESSVPAQVIHLKSDTQESLHLQQDQFICAQAQDNYTRVFWVEHGKLQSQLLRATLKNLEQQLPQMHFMRCHRSFLVSLAQEFTLHGNSKAAHLQHRLPIPNVLVSRSAYPKIRSLFG